MKEDEISLGTPVILRANPAVKGHGGTTCWQSRLAGNPSRVYPSRMELPNADKAYVEREKVTEYLLNAEHRYGAHKARFFSGFGFRLEATQGLCWRRHCGNMGGSMW
jgi:hypothetical protein